LSHSNDDQKRELECLRLASDLERLAKDHPDRDLKAHCLAMARFWSGHADRKPARSAGIAYAGRQSVLLH
jgi:hypothetical protein